MDIFTLLNTIEMPEEAVGTVGEIDGGIKGDPALAEEYLRIRREFFDGADVRPALADLSGRIGRRECETALWFFAACADETERRMKEQGHSEKVFIDSMRDLMIWAKFCKTSHGVWGIKEFEWISRTARAELWRFGRLQFERERYNYGEFSLAGHTVRPGDAVINVHIPADGPFPAEARLDSYKRAYGYFGMDTFMCESYLLYPPQEKYLDPRSNIVSFLHEYHIVKSDRAYSLRNLRYLYGDMEKYDLASLPRDTSLRRSIMRMIDETGDMGYGVGVFFFDGKEII